MRHLTAFFTLTLVLLAAMPAAAARHVATEGRIRSYSYDRSHDGYRVTLEHDSYSFWIPASVLGRRQLRVGAEVRIAGNTRGDYVWVDDLAFIDRGGEEFLSGRIERLNRYEQRLTLHDERGRTIEVDARPVSEERGRRLQFADLHRGDRVTLRGRWERGTFRAFRIESIR